MNQGAVFSELHKGKILSQLGSVWHKQRLQVHLPETTKSAQRCMFCHENGVCCFSPINAKRENDWKNKQEEKTFGSFWVLSEDKAGWVLSSCDLITGFAVSPR